MITAWPRPRTSTTSVRQVSDATVTRPLRSGEQNAVSVTASIYFVILLLLYNMRLHYLGLSGYLL